MKKMGRWNRKKKRAKERQGMEVEIQRPRQPQANRQLKTMKMTMLAPRSRALRRMTTWGK